MAWNLTFFAFVAVGLAGVSASAAQDRVTVERAAAKHLPEVAWQQRSVVTGNFSCSGRKEQAILGLTESQIVIAVFLNGLNRSPEVLRYSAKARYAKTAVLQVEDLDYDPKEMLGTSLDGFERSKSCKGLNLDDGETDSAHIYWNRKARHFEDWTL